VGQAKLRGSFESRKQAAIIREQEEWELQARLREERERNKTPEQRARERKSAMAMATILMFSGYYNYYPLDRSPLSRRNW